jgi:hypothetical protein
MKKQKFINSIIIGSLFLSSCTSNMPKAIEQDLNYFNFTASEKKVEVGRKTPILLSVTTNPLSSGKICKVNIEKEYGSFDASNTSVTKKDIYINYDGKLEVLFYPSNKSGEAYITASIENNGGKIEKLISINIIPVNDILIETIKKEVKEKEDNLISFKVPIAFANNKLTLKSSLVNSLRSTTDSTDKYSDLIEITIDANGYASAIFKSDSASQNEIILTALLFDVYKSTSIRVIPNQTSIPTPTPKVEVPTTPITPTDKKETTPTTSTTETTTNSVENKVKI